MALAWLRRLLRGRQRRYALLNLWYAGSVLAGVLAVNQLVARWPLALDASGGLSRTLRPETARVAAGLTVDVEIVAFLPEGTAAARARGLFGELSALSPRIFAQVIDPEADPQAVKDAKIGPGEQVLLRARGRESRISSAEELPIAQALARLTAEKRRDICFSAGHGEREARDESPAGISGAAALLSGEGFAVRSLSLSRLSALEGCRVVVVAGPSTPLDDAQRGALAAHALRGGGLLLLAEAEAPGGLEALFSRLGFDGPGPPLSDPDAREQRAVSSTTAADHPATAALSAAGRAVTFYNPGPVYPRGGVPSEPLLLSVPGAQPEGGAASAYPLAQALDFQPGRVVALGDVEFLSNNRLDGEGNREFWLGLVGWLAEDLLDAPAPAPPLSAQDRRRISLIAQVAAPGLFSLLALYVWRRRRTP